MTSLFMLVVTFMSDAILKYKISVPLQVSTLSHKVWPLISSEQHYVAVELFGLLFFGKLRIRPHNPFHVRKRIVRKTYDSLKV